MASRIFDWFYPIIFIALIYLTLPIGPRVILYVDQNVLKGHLSYFLIFLFFSGGVILTLASVIRYKLDEPIRYLWLIAVFLAVFDIIQMPGNPAEQIHFLEYGIVSILLWRTLRSYSADNRQIYAATFLLTSSLGCLDEMIQFFLPNRFYGYDDMVRNVSGGALGMIFLGLIERKKHKNQKCTDNH